MRLLTPLACVDMVTLGIILIARMMGVIDTAAALAFSTSVDHAITALAPVGAVCVLDLQADPVSGVADRVPASKCPVRLDTHKIYG